MNPKSNIWRSGKGASALSIFLFFALSLSLGWAYSASNQPDPAPPVNSQIAKSDTAKTNKQPAANPQGTQENPIVIKRLDAEETTERREQQAAEREEKATNERRVVFWTWILALSTISLALIAGGQLWMFSRQLKLMERDAKNTSILTNAALDNATAARESANTLVAAERAHLFVQIHINANEFSTTYPGQPPGFQTCKILSRNGGKTPAILRRVNSEAKILPKIPDAIDSNAWSDVPDGGIVIVSDKFQEFIVPFIADDEQLKKIESEELRLYCFGCIEYEDIMGCRRETGFCWYYIPHTKSFVVAQSNLNRRT